MTMEENDTRGVRYYSGQLPPGGIYANVKDNKPYPLCGLYAAGLMAVAAVLVYVLSGVVR